MEHSIKMLSMLETYVQKNKVCIIKGFNVRSFDN